MPRISKPSLVRNGDDGPTDERAACAAILNQAHALCALATEQATQGATFAAFELRLLRDVFELARTVLVLFLIASETRVMAEMPSRLERGGRRFRRAPAQWRRLTSWFGVLRYRRTYMREVGTSAARGFHPLDAELGLLSDRFSPNLLSIAARLATRTSFADVRLLLSWFVPTPPSTEVIESTVLGYGRHTQQWFQSAPAPTDDGDVLVIQIDSKGVPTATETELARRRGKRKRRKVAPSPRHRGRAARGGLTLKPRRKKGDKSKNAKMGTMVVMYTLRREGKLLLGPINKRYYASFAQSGHAVEVARREATKRGLPPGTPRTVQVLTDGDRHLEVWIRRLFPDAIHTIDVMHVVEKLWDAGSSIHREGSPECAAWVQAQKARLYGGKAAAIVTELAERLAAVSPTGPGNKYRREKLFEIHRYLASRPSAMDYRALRRADLELGTGPVEGAIKNLMYRRMDHGGMRWIKERAEAVLQLRCIDANGDWTAFTDKVHADARLRSSTGAERVRLQQRTAAELPQMNKAA